MISALGIVIIEIPRNLPALGSVPQIDAGETPSFAPAERSSLPVLDSVPQMDARLEPQNEALERHQV
jgi:hypothetical protein